MKAFVSHRAPSEKIASFVERELPRPTLRPHDVLVDVRAVATNPVDLKVTSSGRDGELPLVAGWDFAGVVMACGACVHDLNIGDEVWGAGDVSRAGCYAEEVAVDTRLISKKPRTATFAEAAALPLTSLTAWEALIARRDLVLDRPSVVLVIGGAGGVGSIATQLLKAKTQARVIATASRPESAAWCLSQGADATVDHNGDLLEQIRALGIRQLDAVLSTTQTDKYLSTIHGLLRPFGSLCLIDDPKVFDIAALKRKAISVHWELMFTKALFGYALETQGQILAEVAALVDSGKVRSTMSKRLVGLTVANLAEAQQLLVDGKTSGKIVIECA